MEQHHQIDQSSQITDHFGKILCLDSPTPFPPDEQVHEDVEIGDDDDDDDVDEGDDDDAEFEFSFAGGDLSSLAAAEELFRDGKIRPIFPFFADENASTSDGETSCGPPVRKVFVVEDDDVAEGPYCAWSSENSTAEEPAPEMSKRSYSTGFSKLWKVKHLLVRSNSDGKDAFVFLPGKETAVPAAGKEKKVRLSKLKTGSDTAANGDTVEKKKPKAVAATGGTTAYGTLYGKKGKKKGGKSYLPYRQDLVGFFTNANAMTRNVHPY